MRGYESATKSVESCLETMGEERGVCVEQSPLLNHRAALGSASAGGGGGGGCGGGGNGTARGGVNAPPLPMSRMRPSHSSQDVASISHEQDYWEYGPGIVDRLKSKFINLSMSNQSGGQNGVAFVSHSANKKNHLRACASLENLQEPGSVGVIGVSGSGANTSHRGPSVGAGNAIGGASMNATHKLLMTSPANMRHHESRRGPLVPKSPSMEILLLDSNRSHDSSGGISSIHRPNNVAEPSLRSSIVSSSISSVVESELPRRDIVRKYKSFFEQTSSTSSTSSSPQHHLSNGSLHQPAASSYLLAKANSGSGGGTGSCNGNILRLNKTSPVKKPIANIKPLRKEQQLPELESRESPPLNKVTPDEDVGTGGGDNPIANNNKDHNSTGSNGMLYGCHIPHRGSEAALNEINLQASSGQSRQSHSAYSASPSTAVASPDIMSINCPSDNRPQSSSTPISSRQAVTSCPAPQQQPQQQPQHYYHHQQQQQQQQQQSLMLSSAADLAMPRHELRTPSLVVKPRACPLLLSESNSRPLPGCLTAATTMVAAAVASASAGGAGAGAGATTTTTITTMMTTTTTSSSSSSSSGPSGPIAGGLTTTTTTTTSTTSSSSSSTLASLGSNCTTMVFDFRGKDVKPQVAVMPSPVRPQSKDELDSLDESSEPSGITFIGENVVVGGGSLISTRNKKLSIRFDEQNISSFFEYEAEDEADEDENRNEDRRQLDDESDASAASAVCGLPSAVLGNYKPGVLSSDEDDFQLGVSRLRRQQEEARASVTSGTASSASHGHMNDGGLEGGDLQATPAPHDETSVYSQVGSSDLLF